MRDESVVIPVRVVKPFDEVRTPCPPAGSIGELYRDDGELLAVRFPLPMTDQDGNIWESQGDGSDNYMRLKFKIDEIEAAD